MGIYSKNGKFCTVELLELGMLMFGNFNNHNLKLKQFRIQYSARSTILLNILLFVAIVND